MNKSPTWARRDGLLQLTFIDNDKTFQLDFGEDLYIIAIRWWNKGDLVAGFGDPNWAMSSLIDPLKRTDVHREIELFQAPIIKEFGMAFDWIKPEEVIEGYPKI